MKKMTLTQMEQTQAQGVYWNGSDACNQGLTDSAISGGLSLLGGMSLWGIFGVGYSMYTFTRTLMTECVYVS